MVALCFTGVAGGFPPSSSSFPFLPLPLLVAFRVSELAVLASPLPFVVVVTLRGLDMFCVVGMERRV